VGTLDYEQTNLVAPNKFHPEVAATHPVKMGLLALPIADSRE
jgi:hypothetical protein